LPDKGYGFIEGDDRNDYFFRKESFTDATQIDKIGDGAFVTFDERATPKGYRADRLSLVSPAHVATFVLPDEVVISKTDRLPGWELLEIGDWVVHGASRDSPDQAKRDQQLEQKIRSIHQRKSTTGSVLFIGALVCLVAQIGSFIPSIVLCFAGGIALLYGSTYRWIEYRRAPIAME